MKFDPHSQQLQLVHQPTPEQPYPAELIGPGQWVDFLYHGMVANGSVEFRMLKGGRVEKHWMPHPCFYALPEFKKFEDIAVWQKHGHNAFFGVSLRKKEGISGDDQVHPTHLIWADLDMKRTAYLPEGTDPLELSPEVLRAAAMRLYADVMARCATQGLRPLAVVYSGHGLQLYFARSARSTTADTVRMNLGLFELFQDLGADKTVRNPERILRVPGGYNLKNPERPLQVEVWHIDADARVQDKTVEALISEPEPRPTAPAVKRTSKAAPVSSDKAKARAEKRRRAEVTAAVNGEAENVRSAPDGERNNTLNIAAVKLARFLPHGELEEGELIDALTEAATAAGLEAGEIAATIRSGIKKGTQDPADPERFEEEEAQREGMNVGKKKASAGVKVSGAKSADSEGEASGLPEIEVGGRQLRDIADDSVSALVAANEPPAMFRRAGELVRLVTDGEVRIKLFDHIGLKGELARCADFVKTIKTKDGFETSPARPPADLAPDLLARVDRLPFPRLHLLATTPVYAAAGELVSAEGYHPDSGIFLSLQGLQLPELPSPADALALLREMLCDFPFTHDAGFAHTLSAILLPFLRSMIDGPTPLILVEASTRGTGKGLLCEVVPLVALGTDAGVMVQPRDGDEFEKRVTSMLLEGSRVILLDNVHTLKGEALAAALTARTWRGRRLGKSEMLTLQNDALWMATGNNVTLDDDMPRRIIPIRLDAGMERPENRTGFRHPKLLTWIRQNRPALVAACVSLVEAWKTAGQPEGTARLGSYESWSAVLGGVLGVAGVPGFLQGREHLYEESNPEPAEWGNVLETIHAVHGSKPQHARVFLSAMQGLGTHVDLWEGHKPLSQMQRVGRALLANRDRVFKGRRIRTAGIDASTKSKVYRVELIADVPGLSEATTPETPDKPREKEAVQEGTSGVSGVYGVLSGPIYAKSIPVHTYRGADEDVADV